jgi:hypothetical protein
MRALTALAALVASAISLLVCGTAFGITIQVKKFSGKIGRRRLKPGRYRATLVATDAARNASKPKRLRFRVVRR